MGSTAEPDARKGDKVKGQRHGNGPLPKGVFGLPRADLAPQLVDGDAEAIEPAPDDKVPAGSVPQTAQQHGHPNVDVGGHPGVKCGNARHGQGSGEHHPRKPTEDLGVGPHQGHKRQQKSPADGGKPRGPAVAPHGDVEVILEPPRQAHVPALPEVATAVGLVWAVEVLGQVVAHEQSHADGHVGVSTEIGVDLQGIAIHGHEDLKTTVCCRRGKHAVIEIDRNPIRQKDLLEQSIQNPEAGAPNGGFGHRFGVQNLGHKVSRPDNGTGHKLRKEGHIKPKVAEPLQGLNQTAANVHRVADRLKGVKANAHRQQNAVD